MSKLTFLKVDKVLEYWPRKFRNLQVLSFVNFCSRKLFFEKGLEKTNILQRQQDS
jgi:hypothetical protein